MSRALVIGGLALVVLAAAGGAYYVLKKGDAVRTDLGASEHIAAPDGTAAGETVKDTLGTDEGGGIADDASSAVDAVEEGGETLEGDEAIPETATGQPGAAGDVFGDSDAAALRDEPQQAEDASQAAEPN